MCVNFFNTLTEAFESRLTSRIRLWAGEDAARVKRVHAIKKAICGWGVQEPTAAVFGEAVFVESERAHLGNPEVVTKVWLKTNYEIVLKTYWRWLSMAGAGHGKIFTLMPFFKIKRHFINIDKRVLHYILSESGAFKAKTDDVLAMKESSDLQWKWAFNFSRLVTRKWSFSGMIETDGVRVHPHFKAYKTEQELQKIRIANEAKAKNKEAKMERDRLQKEDPELAEKQLLQSRKDKAKATRELNKARKAAAVEKPTPSQRAFCETDIPEGCLAGDPGANPNLLSCVYKKKGKIIRKILTKGQYYTDGGVRKSMREAQRWMHGIREAQGHLDSETMKTASVEVFDRYLVRYAQVYNILWDEKLKRRWARNRFGTYVRKAETLDAYFKKLKADGAGIRAAYIGGGKWSPSQKGRETVPVDIVSRRFRRYFSKWNSDTKQHVSYAKTVQEDYTSQCCFRCGDRTCEVFEKVVMDGARREENKKNKEGWKNDRKIRGLRFCDSKSCGCLIDRDFQGAMNIMGLGLAEDGGRSRPTHLVHETAAMKRVRKFFLSDRSSVCRGGRKLIPPYRTDFTKALVSHS